MELSRVSAKEYATYFTCVFHTFNTAGFAELNSDKCDTLHYLLFIDKKVRLGIILGERDHLLLSPFSAPFGGFSFIKSDIRLEYIEEAIGLLEKYASASSLSVKISLPPSIYEPSFVAKQVSLFFRSRFQIEYVDLNYHFETEYFSNYEQRIDRGTRNKLHNSFKQQFLFQKLDSERVTDVERAYRVIKANREGKGYPLRMTLQNVLDTIKIIRADFFILTYQEKDIAAAQVFHVADDTVQVIYWGDAPGYTEIRAMNYLAYKVFEYYASTGIKFVDIGPSSERGIPNYGLCEFKENIGCTPTLKYTFRLMFKPEVSFVDYDQLFLTKSRTWLQDKEMKRLTMAADCTSEEQKKWFASLKARKDYLIWGLLADGRPIGACGLKHLTKNSGEYWGYIGDKNYWGKGIGSVMLRFIENQAINLKLSIIYLHVLADNIRAIKLYRKLGYIEKDSDVSVLYMEKKL